LNSLGPTREDEPLLPDDPVVEVPLPDDPVLAPLPEDPLAVPLPDDPLLEPPLLESPV